MYFASSVVEAESPGLEDGGDGLCDPPSRQIVIKVLGGGLALIDILGGADKPLKTDIAIAGLAAVTTLGEVGEYSCDTCVTVHLCVRDIAYVERIERHEALAVITGQRVAPVALPR